MLLPLAVALSLTAPPPAATAVRADDPPVQIWIDPAGSLMQGDRVRVHVRTAQDAYLVVLRVDGDGRVRALFPLDPSDDDFARGGDKFELRGRGDRETFFVDERDGTGAVLVAAAKSPFKFDEFVRGDHWDYRVLASDQARSDPEAALLDLVRRMAGDQHFDYDIVTYTVGDIAYQSSRYRPYYGGGYGGYGYGGWYGGYGFGLGFGRPSYYCDPFFDFYCDSFYNGYGYDPFYYGGLRYGYCWWCAPRVFVYSRNVFAPNHPGFLARFRGTRTSAPPFVLPSNPVTRRPVPAVVTRPPVENQPSNARPADRPPDRRSTGDAKPSNRPTRDARPADRPSDRRATPSRGGDNRSGGGQARPRNDSGRNHMDFFPQRSSRSFSSPSRSFSRPTPTFSPRSSSGGGIFRSMTRSSGGGSRSGGGGGRRR